eukprot:CAMPEP_0170523476 /NCGR_PEP_ID=MMETSP0209-20121228/8879_1 /TAXON_ID=665100 ORGANISM="Litonotus pictus, Strain P1" /NCGR_SAMPLE_ID=MMETSP0209 /ASSEMBLY_ACC=CAM_ASM_000301 /LENGTH=331 /DNA_ID=CAMNT_0010811561 /DNA_START=208 /DNA_END=1203 /DNA_ORIENTATION=+
MNVFGGETRQSQAEGSEYGDYINNSSEVFDRNLNQNYYTDHEYQQEPTKNIDQEQENESLYERSNEEKDENDWNYVSSSDKEAHGGTNGEDINHEEPTNTNTNSLFDYIGDKESTADDTEKAKTSESSDYLENTESNSTNKEKETSASLDYTIENSPRKILNLRNRRNSNQSTTEKDSLLKKRYKNYDEGKYSSHDDKARYSEERKDKSNLDNKLVDDGFSSQDSYSNSNDVNVEVSEEEEINDLSKELGEESSVINVNTNTSKDSNSQISENKNSANINDSKKGLALEIVSKVNIKQSDFEKDRSVLLNKIVNGIYQDLNKEFNLLPKQL